MTDNPMNLPVTHVLRGTKADPTIINIINAIPKTMPLDLTQLRGMGMLNSHKYREIFITICTKHGYSPEVQFYIILAATIVKDPERIKRGLAPHARIPVVAQVIKFYTSNSVKYVGDVRPATMFKLFPTVKIPESFPSVAAICYVLVEGKGVKPSDLVWMMARNLWFCQLQVNEELMKVQKDWEEVEYWGIKEDTGMVQGSKFAGTRAVPASFKFNLDIWKTKSKDNYSLMLADGQVWEGEITPARLEDFIKAVIKFHNVEVVEVVPEIEVVQAAKTESLLDKGMSFLFGNKEAEKKEAENKELEKKEMEKKAAAKTLAEVAEEGLPALEDGGDEGVEDGQGDQEEGDQDGQGGPDGGDVGEEGEVGGDDAFEELGDEEDVPELAEEGDDGAQAASEDDAFLDAKRRIYPSPAQFRVFVKKQTNSTDKIGKLMEAYLEFYSKPEDPETIKESFNTIVAIGRSLDVTLAPDEFSM
jgi:hypothetical protein